MELSLASYNFLAEKNNWNTVSTSEELDSGCTEHSIKKMYSTISVSDYTVIDDLYTFGYGDYVMGGIKQINGVVTEYYTKVPEDFIIPGPSLSHLRVEWVSRDLNTDEIIEYYSYNRNSISKSVIEYRYNMEGELLQTTYIQTELPQEYQDALVNYPDKDKIWSYSTNSQGMIIEIVYS